MSWSEKGQQLKNVLAKCDWYLCFGGAFLVAILIGLLLIASKLHHVVNDADMLPIESVVIKGQRNYTTDKDIQLALRDLMDRSFFSADVNQIQGALEALPWVYQASVRRKWPNKLMIFLVEQTPVAHWNGDAWLNQYGAIFDAQKVAGMKHLPALNGPEDQASNVLKAYQQLDGLLEINGFSLDSLSLSPRHAWHGVLDSGIKLRLGREDKMARIQRFINVYPILAKQGKTINKIDLRYDTGLAVAWNDAHKRAINK